MSVRQSIASLDNEPNRPRAETLDDDEDGRPSKRRRVALACNRCRKQKSRCDGAQPHCSVCVALGYDCSYPANENTQRKENTSELREQLLALEERLRALESQAANSGGNNLITAASSPAPKIEVRPGSYRNGATVDQSSGAGAPDSRQEVDAVDSMGTIAPAAEVNAGFFGPSSNIAFVDHIWNAITSGSNTNGGRAQMQSEMDAATLHVSRTYRTAKDLDDIDLFAFPSDSESRRLLRHYFDNTGLLFPYVHEESMYDAYVLAKETGFRGLKLSWLALFNMVLAQGNSTRTDDRHPATDRIAASDVFYNRALGLSRLQDMHGANVETVQYLLLMVQYLQSTQRSSHTWTVYGSAVKAAFSIGLHSEKASRLCSPLDREIRKRTWFGCVMLDRTLGMTLGRPAAIPQSYNRLSMPEPFPASNMTPSAKPTSPDVSLLSMEFFTATIQLYKIMWTVLDVLYGQNMGFDSDDTPADRFCHIIKLDHELMAWRQGLPPSLETTETIPTVDMSIQIPQRLQSILTLRYLSTRVLLHRPVLTTLLDDWRNALSDAPEARMLRSLSTNSVRTCLECATQIISLVHAHGERKAALGAWWFSLYYTFNAALVILAISFIRNKYPDLADLIHGPTHLRASFSLAIHALRVIDTGNPIVDRCRRYLGKLQELKLFDEPARYAGEMVNMEFAGQQQVGMDGMMVEGMPPDFSWDLDGTLGMEMGEYMRSGPFGLFPNTFDHVT